MPTELQPRLDDEVARRAWRAMFDEAQALGLMAPMAARSLLELAALCALLGAALQVCWRADGGWPLLLGSAAVSVLLARLAFLGHDAGHGARSRSPRLDRAIGQISMTVAAGLAFDEWIGRHRAHHRFCQDEARDPDMAVDLVVSLSAGSLAAKGHLGRWLTRWQAVHVWCLSLLFAHSQRHLSQWGVLRRLRAHRLDALLLLVHLALWFGLPCLLLGVPPGRALVVYLLPLCLLGPHLAAIFWVNHIGMPLVRRPEDFSFLEHQSLSSRNVAAAPGWRWLFGGLNLQIEHHLFPTVPSTRLHALQPVVRRQLGALGLPYQVVSWPAALQAVGAHLRVVARLAEGGHRP